MSVGQREQLAWKFGVGLPAKPALHDLSDAEPGEEPAGADLAAILPDGNHPSLAIDAEDRIATIEQDPGPMFPARFWAWLTNLLLAGNPRPACFEKRARLPLGAPARQGHANRAVGQDAQNIATCSAMTDENHRSRLWLSGLRQRQTELHRGLP